MEGESVCLYMVVCMSHTHTLNKLLIKNKNINKVYKQMTDHTNTAFKKTMICGVELKRVCLQFTPALPGVLNV